MKCQEFFLEVVLILHHRDLLNRSRNRRLRRLQLKLLQLEVHYLLDVSTIHRLELLFHKHCKSLKDLLQLMGLQ
jgi:hypothetical protein